MKFGGNWLKDKTLQAKNKLGGGGKQPPVLIGLKNQLGANLSPSKIGLTFCATSGSSIKSQVFDLKSLPIFSGLKISVN